MNKLTTVLITSLAGALTLAGAACSSSSSSSNNDSGSGSGTIPLPSTSTGFVQDMTSGVIGAWFAYGDGVGMGANTTTTDNANSDCVLKGGFAPADCSQITSPTPGQPFPPTDPNSSKMCTSGTAAVVLNKNGNPDYTDLFGAGIGLDFNNPGGDSGAPAGYLDLSAYAGIEFDFTADVLPTNAMRVNFPFKTMHNTDSPFWMGATASSSPLTGKDSSGNAPQHVKVAWSDVGGPFYLTQQTPPVDITQYPFDPKNVQAIQFQVFTNTKTTTPYSFCVANLALTKK